MDDKVVFVLLRQPNLWDPDDSRDDPFYEFGCYGLTGCHRNLLRGDSVCGARLAFVQGGPGEFRLVLVTAPVRVESGGRIRVARWEPPEMPLRFADAPALVGNRRTGRATNLAKFVDDTKSPTPVSQFQSRFRIRTRPLEAEFAAEVLDLWNSAIARHRRCDRYDEALPYPPRRPLGAPDRRNRFTVLLRATGLGG